MSGVFAPRWTANGGGVIYAERAANDVGYQFVDASVDGIETVLLDDVVAFTSPPVWSLDGCDLVSSVTNAGDIENADLVISRDGGEPQSLTTSPATDFFPDWSRDGETIAFVRMDSASNTDAMTMTTTKEPSGNILLIDVDGETNASSRQSSR